MEIDESHEAKLLRLLIGYFHVSLLNQLSLARYAKMFDQLEEQDKQGLQNVLLAGVASVAQSVTPGFVEKILSSLPPPSPILH